MVLSGAPVETFEVSGSIFPGLTFGGRGIIPCGVTFLGLNPLIAPFTKPAADFKGFAEKETLSCEG